MMQIKNLKAGWLFITDAGLKLMAGQVASVGKLTPQTEMLIARGYVALMDTPLLRENHLNPQKWT